MNINANSVIVSEEENEHNDYYFPSEQIRRNAENKKGFTNNIKDNANKDLLKFLGWGMLGAGLYPTIPTLFQSVTENDMSGWKGLIMGVGVVALFGLATGKTAMTIGACSAAATHTLYAKGTKIVEDITNTQIFRMNPDSVVYEIEKSN